jgi:F420-non-reducing hydrogenase iron-sulfur subunit
MKLLGIDQKRLHLKWISASEGAIFADEIRSFTQLLKELGSPAIAGMVAKEQGAPPSADAARAQASSQLPEMASA